MINCYAFSFVPPFAKGLVRDLRVRWALEEAELPHRVTLVGEGAMSVDAYRAIQPFGQIPAIEDGALRLFESGAIVQYVAERSERLMPKDPAKRAEVSQWMYAALNTIEMPIMSLAEIDLFYPEERWAKERRPGAVERVQQRLGELAGAPRRPRASRGRVLGRRHPHDERPPHPPPHGSRRGAAGARRLQGTLRRAPGVPEGARRPARGVRRYRARDERRAVVSS